MGSRLDRRGEDFALARFQGRTQEAPPLAPSISSFSPTSGPVGTWVTIGGSGLTGATSVRFGDAYQPSFTVDPSGTSIVAVVPTGATTGPITVTTPNVTVVSTSSFVVTSTPTEHVRNVTLRLSKHLRTNGRIVVYDGFASCVQGRNVRIQRSFEGDWRTIAHDVTDADGRYSYRVPDRTGWYRAVIRQVTLPTGDTCNAAISGTRHHTAR
ncbi:MAG: IPT/TIG domain-containing protein [Actinomycetota bacterium]